MTGHHFEARKRIYRNSDSTIHSESCNFRLRNSQSCRQSPFCSVQNYSIGRLYIRGFRAGPLSINYLQLARKLEVFRDHNR